jgi:hypothetical protein
MLIFYQRKVVYRPAIAAPGLLLESLSIQHMSSETVYRLSAVLQLLLIFTLSTPRSTKIWRGEM